MGDNSNQPSFLLTSPVTRSWRWHKQWIHQHTYEQGLWVMHIGKPIERTVASTFRPCFSLSTKQPHEVGIFNIASIFFDAVCYHGQKMEIVQHSQWINSHCVSMWVTASLMPAFCCVINIKLCHEYLWQQDIFITCLQRSGTTSPVISFRQFKGSLKVI